MWEHQTPIEIIDASQSFTKVCLRVEYTDMPKALPFTELSLARAIKGVERETCYSRPMRKARKTEVGARYVYVIKRDDKVCKIGISRNPRGRRNGLQDSSPEKLELIIFSKPKSRTAIEIEQTALRMLDFMGRRGEWISCRSEFAAMIVTGLANDDMTIEPFVARIRAYHAQQSPEERASLWSDFHDLMFAYEGRRFGQRLLRLLRS